MDITNLTITKTHKLLKDKDVSATELARAYFDRIKDKDKEIHAYLAITEKLAFDKATEIDAKIADGLKVGVLEGAPGAIKDNILIEGVRATAGSKILEIGRASCRERV